MIVGSRSGTNNNISWICVPLKLLLGEVSHIIQMCMDLLCQCKGKCNCPDLRSLGPIGRLSTVPSRFLLV
jgi:hypothetical protein